MSRVTYKITFCLLFCGLVLTCSSFAQEQLSTPQVGNDEYRKLVDEYRTLLKRHAELLDETVAKDPAFGRAKFWLENEHLEVSTPAREEDKKFSESLTEEDRKRYYDWQRGLISKVNVETLDNEWKKYPDSHRVLLLWAAVSSKMIQRQFQSSAADNTAKGSKSENEFLDWAETVTKQLQEMQKNSSSGANFIQELENESQWLPYLNFARKYNVGLVSQVPDLTKSLGIKQEMIKNLETAIANTALFNPYESYYRLYYPSELTTLASEQRKISNKLSEINPNWWYNEGLESRESFDNLPVSRPSLQKWLLIGVGVALLLYGFIRMIFSSKRKSKKDNE